MNDPQETIRSMMHAYNEVLSRMHTAEENAKVAMQEANHWAACCSDYREMIETLRAELDQARKERAARYLENRAELDQPE